jgi:hypothetical protein
MAKTRSALLISVRLASVTFAAAVSLIAGASHAQSGANLPPSGAYQPIPNYTGVGAGLLFRNAINDRFSGVQPISPIIVNLSLGNLPPESDGALIYCNDCKQTNPCSSGGSGAWAFGAQGQWECTAPGLGGSNSSITSLTGVQTMTAPAVGGTIGNYDFANVLNAKNPLYGASGSSSTLSCTATSGSATLTGCTVSSGSNDFSNGEHVMVDGAGAATTFSTPSAPTATVTGATGTSYEYKCAAYDAHGGYSAASSATTASAAATLDSSANFVKLTGTNESGAQAYACWGSSNGGTNWYLIQRTDDMSYGAFDGAVNLSTFPNEGTAPPPWIPASPPAAAVNDRLLATISSGGGTSSITLAASSNYSGTVVVRHDDTAALAAWATALNAVPAAKGFLPTGDYQVCGEIGVSGYASIYGAGAGSQIDQWCGTGTLRYLKGGTDPNPQQGTAGRISDVSIVGQNIATAGLTVENLNEPVIEHNAIGQVDGNALALDGTQNTIVLQNQLRLSNNDLAFVQGTGAAPAGNRIAELEMSSAWGWCFEDSTTDQHQMNTVADSRCEYNPPFSREPEKIHFNSTSGSNAETWNKVAFSLSSPTAGLLSEIVHSTSIDQTQWACSGCSFSKPANVSLVLLNEGAGLKRLLEPNFISWSGATLLQTSSNLPVLVWLPNTDCSLYSMIDPNTNVDWIEENPYNSHSGLYMCHGYQIQGPMVNSVAGYRYNGGATSGHYLRGNGTYFVDSPIQAADLTGLRVEHYAGGSAGTAASTISAGVIYMATSGNQESSAEGNVALLLPAGTLKNFYCYVPNAPGTSNSYQCTMRDNFANSSLSCTISGAAQSCTDSTNTVTINTSDRYDVAITTTVGGAAPTATYPRTTVELDY